MKNALGLVLNSRTARTEKKYLGDPESPNFLPDSPLIERPILSTHQESELKWICGLVLANVKSSDDSGTDPLSEIIQSLQAQEVLPTRDVPQHDGQIPARKAPKPAASSRQHIATKNEVRPKHVRDDAGMFNLHLKPAFTDSPVGQPRSAHSNEEVLWTIRSRMSSRPKTSAAACVDYVAENTDPSSRPSNRTTYTTYSTPATSIGYPAVGRKKSYTQDEPAMPALNFYGLLSPGDSPSRESAQVRAWMDEQYERGYLHGSNGFEYQTSSLREFYPTPRLEEAEQIRTRMKRSSIRNKVQEYFRPGSSASNAPPRGSVASNIKNYIRPGSSSGSVRSVATDMSTRSKSQDHWSSIKRKFSNASRTSQRSNRKEATDGGQNHLGEAEIDLNRPLPPLPGLDSYKEKQTHIASLMKKVQSPKANATAATGSRPETCSNHSTALNFHNEATKSLGSTPMSLKASNFTQKSTSNLENIQNRSHRAKAAVTVSVSPLSQSTVPKTALKKEGFAKKWGGKFSLVKKPKVVVVI